MMMELISGLIGVVIGSIITYYFSTRLLRKQLEAQQAYDFVSKNYLPLLSAITEYKFSLRMWAKTKRGDMDKDENPLTEREALKICGEAFKLFKEAIEKFVTTGVILIISNIDEKLASYILGLHYRIKHSIFKMSESITDISEVYLNPHFIDELENMLSKVSIPELVREYQNVMKKGFKPKGGS